MQCYKTNFKKTFAATFFIFGVLWLTVSSLKKYPVFVTGANTVKIGQFCAAVCYLHEVTLYCF